MTKVIFKFNGEETKIQCNENDTMEDICKRFCSKVEKNIDKVFFIYGGEKINFQIKYNEIAKNLKEITILVYDSMTYIKEINNQSNVKSKEIICPECEEICLIKIKDYKISLSGCKNGHQINNICLENFKNTQLINESYIKCFKCNNNKNKTYNKQFYLCLTCQQNICPLCKSSHDKKHKIVDYDKKNYICNNHNDAFISYCKDCKNNLCILCEKKHNHNHNIVSYKNIIEDEEKIKEKVNEFKNKIDKMKEKVTDIIDILKKLNEYLDIYYGINNDLVNNYDIQNKNYEYLKNISEIYNIDSNEIDNYNKERDINKQIPILFKIYSKMKYKDTTNTINPPKECLMYQTIANLNNEYNELERQIKKKSNYMMENIKNMKEELSNIKNIKKIKCPDGIYYGQTIEGDFNGLGTFENDDGRKYEGEFLNNDRDGIGIYTDEGLVYYGEYRNDERCGFGIEKNRFDPFGTRYDGGWSDNGLTGTGLLFYEDGRIYIGSLVKAQLDGKGKMVFRDGSYYIGDFKEGFRVQGKTYYSEEKGIFDAKWEFNEKTKETIAKGIFYCLDGTKQKSTRYINGNESVWKFE